MKNTGITEDLANMTSVVTFMTDNIVTIAQMFTSWPLVLIPVIAITGIVFAKAKGLIKLKK